MKFQSSTNVNKVGETLTWFKVGGIAVLDCVEEGHLSLPHSLIDHNDAGMVRWKYKELFWALPINFHDIAVLPSQLFNSLLNDVNRYC